MGNLCADSQVLIIRVDNHLVDHRVQNTICEDMPEADQCPTIIRGNEKMVVGDSTYFLPALLDIRGLSR